ncbi:molybdopterin-dependent oxidoreductase [Halalkalicoccus jeotgali]|uniref:Formate dehydrogenase alpha subunit n=1 Tax=Halalkalicoccus jeotgali (strain DSM 18796 / CECT 7217 / JCM 14584 / KCTC 4019 / B3) TaxID=795797 RepID=D8J9A1_HALJB|nr:molybdopterin-dependent oxidoreductase [Halalkalicoccus jeotgali]ADJ16370.1 formate dehydrogenase alpha subunit [Halalkalicoccus jeotgali B3]ELY37104.1 formate dehydrogenase subunit alpha [Halalkalicoccus jeotgali B3]
MSTEPVSLDLDRRSFLKASALAGAVALGGGAAGQTLAQSEDEGEGTTPDGEMTKTICNYCAVGCGFRGVKDGDSFVGMEPWHENPINNGSLCSKGAGILETEHSDRRLKRPMHRVDGGWETISWSEAYDIIEEQYAEVVEEYTPESVMMMGSAHYANEEAYAFRKLAAFMGTNNCDHQARICHSPTVTGLSNTWGYGAMTNTINDYRNFDLLIICGQNPAESHPIAMQHILEGQARDGTVVSIDPRYTKTSSHADNYYRMRPGTDVALLMGLMNYLREQGELDDEMLSGRVNGWPDAEAELDQYDLETVADITWIDVEQLEELGDLIIENKPNIQIEWAMGGTQHNNGTQNIRSYALHSLASGSAARSGGGLQVMRGHANVQGATDLGVDSTILPGYYSVSAPGSWVHWTNVWDQSPWTSGSTDFWDLHDRFALMPNDIWQQLSAGGGGPPAAGELQSAETERSDASEDVSQAEDTGAGPNSQSPTEADSQTGDPAAQGGSGGDGSTEGGGSGGDGSGDDGSQRQVDPRTMMLQDGLSVARWYEAALQQEDRLHESNLYQPDPLKMAFFWGHSANSITEMDKMKKAMEALDLLVVVDVFPAVAGTLADAEADNVLLLPAASQYEHHRSVTNSHRSVQWSEPVSSPAHASKPDLQIMQELADRFGFGEHFDWGSGPELYNGKSTYEDALREINLGVRTVGYQQSPERLQRQKDHDDAFSTETLRADSEGLPVSGEFWGLPWPCWGEGHPGTPIIWRDDLPPAEGGHDFRANWGADAPTPEEWEATGVDKEYPLAETYEQEGEAGLDMLRESYQPEWFDGEVIGVPQYPGFTTTLPEDPAEASSMTIPMEYALREDVSIYDCAAALNEQRGHQHDLAFYEQYDNPQPDPPTGRGRARAVVWNFIDTVPKHREPIQSPRPDLAEQWPANGQQTNFFRLDQNNATTQQEATQRAYDQGMDVILTSGRQVEHQGGGAETRNNQYTADLQPHMYAEIHPDMAEDLDLVGGEDHVIITSADNDKGSILVKAKVTYRPQGGNEIFLPYHWGGVAHGQNMSDNYPDGSKPLAIGDSANFITSSGFDAETQMQETKAGLVRVEKATEQRIEELNMEFIDYPQEEAGIGDSYEWDVRNQSMQPQTGDD